MSEHVYQMKVKSTQNEHFDPYPNCSFCVDQAFISRFNHLALVYYEIERGGNMIQLKRNISQKQQLLKWFTVPKPLSRQSILVHSNHNRMSGPKVKREIFSCPKLHAIVLRPSRYKFPGRVCADIGFIQKFSRYFRAVLHIQISSISGMDYWNNGW